MDALDRWNQLVAAVNGRSILGSPGVRDPDAPCSAFHPGEPLEDGDCDTDGHYLCRECRHISLVAIRRRNDQCEACGAPLIPDQPHDCEET